MTTFKDHFSEGSAGYAKFRPTYPMALVAALCDDLPRLNLAWEAGCGSGQFSQLLGTRFKRVYATDPSQNQIAHAVRTITTVEYVRETAEECGLDSQSVDLAVSTQAAHWFDLERHYREVKRVVRKGGKVASIGYGNITSRHPIIDTVSDIYGNLLGEYWPVERRHVEQHYGDFIFPFAEIALPTLAIEARLSKEALTGYVLSWSATRVYKKQSGEDLEGVITNSIDEAWGDADLLDFSWPIFGRVGMV